MGAKKQWVQRMEMEKMTKEEIHRKCAEIVVRQLDVDVRNIRADSHFIDDLGADSLAIFEVVLDAEETFDIDIPDEDAEKIRNFGEAVAYVEGRLRPRVR